jgi:hypothetical protein
MAKILAIFTICCFIGTAFAAAADKTDQQILEQLLRKGGAGGYNPDIRPPNASHPDSPITVEVNMYVRHVHYLDEDLGQWKTQLTFRQEWYDPRLTYTPKNPELKYVTLPRTQVIWTPDTFFGNELEAKEHDLWRPNQLLRVFPDGKVLFSSRISLTLASPALAKPSTGVERTSNLRLASYTYTADDLVYVWKQTDPIQITPEMTLKNYKFNKYTTTYCNSATKTGVYSCLKAEFDFTKVVAGVCHA